MFTEADLTQSSGLGGVLDVGGRLTKVSVDLRNLPLPPVGYFYEGWLVNAETGQAMSMGPVTTLPPDTVSLFDADVNLDLPGVTATGIRFANVQVPIDSTGVIVKQDGGTFTVNLSGFVLTLEPKLGAAGKNIADLELGTLPTRTIIERLKQ